MKIYNSQSEVEKDIKNYELYVDGDVKFNCSISIEANIRVDGDITAIDITAIDITAFDINAWDITARDINAWDITAFDINAWDITARDINAWDITARDITAIDITAFDINAWDITARDITYYAFCCVYQSMSCTSIKGRRGNHHPPICLDGELTIKKLDNDAQEAIKLLEEKGYKIVKIKEGEWVKKTKQVGETPKKWDEKFGNVMEQLDKLIELSKTISKMKEE